MRAIAAICLCTFLAGCARPNYVGVPIVNTEPEASEYPSISPGTQIRATLVDGRIVKARFEKFADRALFFSEARLEGSDRDGFNEINQQETEPSDKLYSVPLTEIALLEKSTTGNTNDSVGTFVVVGIVVGIGLMLINPSAWMD